MRMLTSITTLFLLASWMGSLSAAPNQPSDVMPDVPGAMTFSQAQAKYGGANSIYLDGKGRLFWLFALKDGRRLMMEAAPQDKPVTWRLLPPSWQPAPGGHVVKRAGGTLTFVPAPLQRSLSKSIVPPVIPHDRYHPGVKLLARSG